MGILRSRVLTYLFPVLIIASIVSPIPFAQSFSLSSLITTIVLSVMIIFILAAGRIPLKINTAEIFWIWSLLTVIIFSFLVNSVNQNSLIWICKIIFLASGSIVIALFLKIYWKPSYNIHLAFFLTWAGIIGALSIFTDYLNLTQFQEFYLNLDIKFPKIRQVGIFGFPNFAGGQLAIFLPFVSYFAFSQKTKIFKQIFYLLSIGLIIGAILMTGSRTALMMATIVIIASFWKDRKQFFKPRNLVIVSIMIISLIAFLGSNEALQKMILTRVETFEELLKKEADTVAENRIILLKAGYKLFQENPLLGIGLGNFELQATKYTGLNPKLAHNLYVELLAGTGLIGFSFFLGLLMSIVVRFYKYWKEKNIRINFYIFVSFISLIFFLSFFSDITNPYLWIVFLPLSIYISWNKNTSTVQQ